jgi:murein DD-endopeptidase MepM/ murein hydrolase activator NlpD
MRRLVLVLLFTLVLNATALAFEVDLFPENVYPGDAFIIRVTDAHRKPIGVYNGRWLNFGDCGVDCYVAIGVVDLEEGACDQRIALAVKKEKRELTLDVLSKEFPMVELTLQPEKVTLSAEDEMRAEREAEMLRAIWSTDTKRLWKDDFAMPLENAFSTAFGVKRIMNKVKTSVHTGLDIRGKTGEPVKASNRGRVIVAEELFYGGNTLVLDHGQGIYSYYMHLSEFGAEVGDVVNKGDIIGDVGATGRATGPHLHFGVKINETNANPLSVTMLPL